jgi:cytochrome c556
MVKILILGIETTSTNNGKSIWSDPTYLRAAHVEFAAAVARLNACLIRAAPASKGWWRCG